ncbi:MAG: OmpA family protein [Bacteroidales bacterium]|nr:OmpA family protein [Bacteroidales bacterium]
MKRLITLILLCFTVVVSQYGQIDLEGKLKRKINQRANQRVDQAIDKGLDKTEEGIKDAVTQEDADKENTKEEDSKKEPDKTPVAEKETGQPAADTKGPELSWSRYDFIPGNEIIFEDNLDGEENGEFPSRWDLVKGRVENATFDNSNVIYFMTESSQIIPYLKNRDQDYIPEEFTLEFDAWFEAHEYTGYHIWLRDVKNQEHYSDGLYYAIININGNQATSGKNKGMYPGVTYGHNNEKSFWRHVSVSFNRRALKIYLDDARVLNIPNMEVNPSGITIGIDGFGTAGVKGINRFIKDIRLAKGAVKLYDKLMQDGKIVSNGIRFDVGKSTIKPESMGVINQIHKLMNEHSDLKFSVEGHTDSDGSDDLNQQLSEQRAEAVMNKLVSMGIAKDRLTSKGFGESVPVASNDTPEGKASNRRVEFIKM